VLKSLLTSLAALSLAALTAQAAPPITITQSQLPFTISAPGTYVLTGNLSLSGFTPAITIATSVPGTVIVDLKKFTLTGGGSNVGIQIGRFPTDQNTSNTAPITIRNGALTNFNIGIATSTLVPLCNITLNNLDINLTANSSPTARQYGIAFNRVNNGTINSCNITNPNPNNPNVGISANPTGLGDRYIDCTFLNVATIMEVIAPADNVTRTLDHFQFGN
jgi:hypothetical protein